jgi:tRNA A37 threonylcarbamoyladenosine biosynthesis protein TsaE
MGPFWIFLILVAISIISQIATSFADKQRVAALLKAINDAGFDATNSLPEVDAERYFGFELSRKGRLAPVHLAIVVETDTTRVTVFEQRIVVGSGKNKSSKKFVGTLIHDARVQAPAITVTTRQFLATFSKFLGVTYIEFDEKTPFDERYAVRGEPIEAVKEYLTTARRSELAKLQLREFGFNRSTLLIIEWDQKVTVDNYQDSIRKGLELLAVARS